MNWSVYILELFDNGYTTQQIIEQCNMPFITEAFVNRVTCDKSSYCRTQMGPYRSISEHAKKLDKFFETHPIEWIFTKTQPSLAKMVGVPVGAIWKYKTQHVLMNTVNIAIEKRVKKTKSYKEIENLW
jgi:hypothetical protein